MTTTNKNPDLPDILYDTSSHTFPKLVTNDYITSLSNGQQIALCLLPIVPSLLSIISSYTIIKLVIKSKFDGTYNRIFIYVFNM